MTRSTVAFPTGKEQLTLASSYESSVTFAGYVVSNEVFDEAGLKPLDFQVYIKASPDADTRGPPRRRSMTPSPTTRPLRCRTKPSSRMPCRSR